MALLVVLIILAIFIPVRLLSNRTRDAAGFSTTQEVSQSPSSNVKRVKLDKDSCTRSQQVLNDMLGWLSDTKTVEKAIDTFYDKTGVQPYLLICDQMDGKGADITDEEAERFLENLYDTLYDDEGHMLFVFMEYAESEYITFLYTGKAADTVVDADAREIILNYADQYYTDSSLSDEEYFAKIFQDSATAIMK